VELGFGYNKYLSDDLKDAASGVDFTNSGAGIVAYRYSLRPTVDLTFDSRAAMSKQTVSSTDFRLTTSWFGPGVRVAASSEQIRPYAQASFLLVAEKISAEQSGTTVSHSENGAGFGLFGGVDFPVSRHLTL